MIKANKCNIFASLLASIDEPQKENKNDKEIHAVKQDKRNASSQICSPFC